MWDPITTVEQLVERFESSKLDYKTTYDLSKPEVRYDIAKDVAAFANAYGGTIVVGVFEAGGRAVRLDGVADVPGLTEEVKTALRQYCAPLPPTPEDHAILVRPPDAVRLLAASGAPSPPTDVTLVTLNVRADARGPIGVRPFEATRARPMAETYRFPIRVVDHTDFLEPTELPMWMNSHERRIAILLDRALADAVAGVLRVRTFNVIGEGMVHTQNTHLLHLQRVDVEQLIAVFSECSHCGGGAVHIPLSFIPSVWRDAGDGNWAISVSGTVYPKVDGSAAPFRFKPYIGGV